jgi:hypothetical protein
MNEQDRCRGEKKPGSQNKLYLKINIFDVLHLSRHGKIESHLELGG